MSIAKVLLIEDEDFTRSLLAAALTSTLIEVHAGHSARYAVETVSNHDIDVAVLDLDLGGGPSGIDVAHAIRQIKPHIGVIMLTSFSDPRLSGPNERPLPVGSRYITKSGLKEINELITLILKTRSHPLSPEKVNGLTKTSLTDNQVEVFRLVASGASNHEIAKSMDVSEKAVENTITRINDVLGHEKTSSVNPRVQLVRAYSALSGKEIPGGI
jgi:DNA-binding NarL/FixJ family response regulator